MLERERERERQRQRESKRHTNVIEHPALRLHERRHLVKALLQLVDGFLQLEQRATLVLGSAEPVLELG